MATALRAPPYGRDTSCTDRIRPGLLVSGSILLGQAAYRRLVTERGSLEDDPHYGFSLTTWLGKPITDADLDTLDDLIEAELTKDERLESVEIFIARDPQSAGVRLTITIIGRGKEGGSYKLALAASDLTVALLELAEVA